MSDRGHLRLAKLRAIGAQHLGLDVGSPTDDGHDSSRSFADGAGIAAGDWAAVLVGRPTRRSLGPALMWAAKAAIDAGSDPLARLDLVLDPALPVDTPGSENMPVGTSASSGAEPDQATQADHASPGDYAALPSRSDIPSISFGLPKGDSRAVAGQLARIGGLFRPEIRVWLVAGTDVVEIAPAAMPPLEPSPWDDAADQIALLTDVGLELSGEPGMILGEVAGLEVARVTMLNGEPQLDIGVGRFDQELSAVAQADLPRREALERAADLVRLTRTPENGAHPMTRLARERWLRCQLIAEPGLVGATELEAAPGLWVRDGLRNVAPAAAVGVSDAGERLVVVCSAGVDTDLIPAAVELADAVDPEAQLVVALPKSDVLAGMQRVARLVARPVRIVGLAPPWERFTASR